MLDINLFYNRAENKIADLTAKLIKKLDRQGLEGIMDECEVEQINVLSEIIDAVNYDEANAQELIELAYAKFELAEVPTSPFLHIVNNINQQGGGGVTSWNYLTDKPSTFPPSTHTHTQSQVIGLVAKLAELEELIETGGAPLPSTDVVFTQEPGEPDFDGESLTETDSEINEAGNIQTVSSDTLTIPYTTASDKIRRDMIAVNYGVTPPVYVRIAGSEVFSYQSLFRPALPANHLFLRDVDAAFGSIAPAPASPVYTAQTLTYTPSDAVVANGIFSDLLSGGKLFISAALNRIVTKIGVLTSLTTTDKSTLVAAINEVNAKPTGTNYTDADAIKAPLQVVTYTGNATLALTDAGKLVNMASGSACTLTIPNDTAVALPVGTQIPVDWGDAAGQPTMSAGSGVTLQSAGNKYKISEKFCGIILHKIAANTWRMKGATA